MSDQWRGQSSPISLGRRGVPVTPAASDLPGGVAKAVVMLQDGDVTVVPADNADEGTIAFLGVSAGFLPPFQVRRVTACSSSCVAVYD